MIHFLHAKLANEKPDRFVVRGHGDFWVEDTVHALVVIPRTSRLGVVQVNIRVGIGFYNYPDHTFLDQDKVHSKICNGSARLESKECHCTRGQSTSTSVSFMTVTRTAHSKGTEMLLKLMR